jgi:hypothetical protein
LYFGGNGIIQVQQYPLDQTTAPSETQINQHEERFTKGFTPQSSMLLAFEKSYQKLSSNELDFAELKSKPTDRPSSNFNRPFTHFYIKDEPGSWCQEIRKLLGSQDKDKKHESKRKSPDFSRKSPDFSTNTGNP